MLDLQGNAIILTFTKWHKTTKILTNRPQKRFFIFLALSYSWSISCLFGIVM